jgi:hypothetical protein
MHTRPTPFLILPLVPADKSIGFKRSYMFRGVVPVTKSGHNQTKPRHLDLLVTTAQHCLNLLLSVMGLGHLNIMQ